MDENEKREFGELKTQVAVMAEGMKTLKEQMKEINGHLTKLVWLVVGAIVMAFIQWVLRGGLSATPTP